MLTGVKEIALVVLLWIRVFYWQWCYCRDAG